MENRFCVIGEKLGHTRSPQIHSEFFDIKGENGVYEVREIAREDIGSCRDLLLGYDGVNVTIPYKTDVMKNLDAISDEAKSIGAVNTVKRRGDKLEGYNSDPYGFSAMLKSRGINAAEKRACVLGYGGAAKSVVHALRELGADVTVVSRDPAKVNENAVRAIDYETLRIECEKGAKGYLLVNCTPVGMYPKTGVSPVTEAETATKKIFKKLSFRESLGGGDNIYLTGIMSCGKSTLGRLLAEALGREFVDMDAYIVEREGRTIPELFAEGEKTFRDAESRALYELSLGKGKIVATGGGCIKRAVNRDIMLLSGATVFVRRNIDKIIATADCGGRPLLAEGADKLRGIYAARKSRYYAAAQAVLDNDGDEKEGLDKLMKILSQEGLKI